MADSFPISIRGVNDLLKELHKVDLEMQKSSLSATVAVARKLKNEVRKNLNGPPRWNHRGPGVYGKSVKIAGMPRHVPRAGGLGKFAGDLRRGVGYKRPKVSASGEYKSGVGVGGAAIPQNHFKTRYEAEYPFFAPATAKVAASFEEIYVAAYTKALRKYSL
ncbi:MAG: hypothetical protein M0Z51_15640 [Propionibacterium sp.]|nr:hypothetical protein [Propionibacterium sp.]